VISDDPSAPVPAPRDVGPGTVRVNQAAALTFDDLVEAVRRARRSLVAWGIAGLIAGAILGLVRPRTYTARTSFVVEQPSARSLPSGLGALALQFGLDVGTEAGRSPQFYHGLLGTTGLLASILDSALSGSPGAQITVRQAVGAGDDTSHARLDGAVRRLRKHIASQVDARTGIVSVAVSARRPAAAEGIETLLIAAVRRFNVSARQLQARELRQFLEKRVAAASADLEAAEQALRGFYERNRRFNESPALVFEESRLKRQVELRQDLFVSLSKQLESARIEEVNDTPTITTVDPPFASTRPDGPGILALAIIGLVLGVATRVGRLVLAGR